MQVIIIINKLDGGGTKAKFRDMNIFLVSFISKNMGDIHPSAHEILQADLITVIMLKNETSPCVRDELGRNKEREVTPAAPLCPSWIAVHHSFFQQFPCSFCAKVPPSNETIKAWQFKYAIRFFSSISASHQDKLYPLLHYQQSHCYPR